MEERAKKSESIEMEEVKSGVTPENGESCRQISIDIRQRNASGEKVVSGGSRIREPEVSLVHESTDTTQIRKATSLPSGFQSSYSLASIDSSMFKIILDNLSKYRSDSTSAAVRERTDSLEDNCALVCDHCREEPCSCKNPRPKSSTNLRQSSSNAKESNIRLNEDNEFDNLSLEERIRLQCTREYSRPRVDIYDIHDKFEKNVFKAYAGVVVVSIVLVFIWYMLFY